MAGRPEEMHRKEGHVDPDGRIPEMESVPPFGYHVSRPFRRPMVIAGAQG
jgi:hypothetical protein